MDGSRFDAFARALASGTNRRGFVAGLTALAAGLGAIPDVAAACPPGQISRRGLRCVCKLTGRSPVNGACPCPNGQTDWGDGLGCLTCRSDAECPPSDACTAYACEGGSCVSTKTTCASVAPCQIMTCDPTRGCVSTPVPVNEPGRCPAGSVCCADGACHPLGTTDDCTACGDRCDGTTPSCNALLGCVSCLHPSDCGVSDQCTVYTCDGGICGSYAKTGEPCDDGDPCTTDDRCQADGSCLGTSVVCAPQDECHSAACNPADGECVQIPLTGVPCDDNNACTRTDTCQDGACVGGDPVECAPPDQCHEAGICNPATGACEYAPKADGTACDDGNPCTQTDTCQAGVCVGSDPVVCAALDACHDPGVCDTETGLCTNPVKADGTSCSDGNACTQTDTCQTGVCTGDNPVECAPPDQCHEAGTCNPATGECEHRPKADGTPCAGTDLCLTVYTCQAGVCTGSDPVVCPSPDQCHERGVCNPATGLCSNPAKSDDTPCDTGNRCTADTCQAGVCITGPVVVSCPPITDTQCQIAGVCDPATGTCENITKPDGTACDDGDACTQTDTCQAGVCVGGDPIVCAEPDQCHEIGSCDSNTGECTYPEKADGASCDTGNRCTADTCQGGLCVEGPVTVTCPPITDAQCQIAGVCDPATGTCENITKPDGTPCNDGNRCTRTDTCQGGVCTGGNPVVCDEIGACMEGICSPSLGLCGYTVKPNGAPCPSGSCCNGSCCPSGQSCCNGVCCDAGESCCNGVCCAAGESCCGGQCCAAGKTCCNGTCCDGECCSGQCCPTGRTCCFGTCCAEGAPCCNRQCCAPGNQCCSGGGSGNGCCGEDCCGTVCCAFPGARCCPGGVCKVGLSC